MKSQWALEGFRFLVLFPCQCCAMLRLSRFGNLRKPLRLILHSPRKCPFSAPDLLQQARIQAHCEVLDHRAWRHAQSTYTVAPICPLQGAQTKAVGPGGFNVRLLRDGRLHGPLRCNKPTDAQQHQELHALSSALRSDLEQKRLMD